MNRVFNSHTWHYGQGWTIRKVMGGWVGGWGKSKKKKNFPQEIINNRIYSYGFWPKTKYAQRAGKTITDQL